ncbi:Cof-type HAD-IIB family hydrolase [Alloiococcus otitis]|uniref:Cof-type HAD-IIB family hydrolase n=1 Tax=Alloiococcus otitis TaxID=1652 RepID=UPI002356D1C4|nr:Cof-type HAD-IIB family hydrolase [Alloiococcus otitis]
MIKLIAIDIDGTLYNSQKEVSPANLKAVQKALQAGIKIVLCTGRPTPAAIQATKTLGLYGHDNYLITYHGAVTSQLKDLSRTRSLPLYEDQIKQLFDLAQDQNIYAFSQKDTAIQALEEAAPDLAKYEAQLVGLPIEVTPRQDLTQADKFMMVAPTDKLDQVAQNLTPDLYNHYTILRSEPRFIEFIHKDSDKGRATAQLADQLGIPMSEVMGIGDGGNDLQLIDQAGLGVAMGNAVQDLKDKADYVTASNDQDGLAQAFEKFVF